MIFTSDVLLLFPLGVHFYATQFIEGQTLGALIQELRQQSNQGIFHQGGWIGFSFPGNFLQSPCLRS
jgi:hypothetical protein